MEQHADSDLNDEIESVSQRQEWLTFTLAGVLYAVDILRVREIRIWENMTRIPYSQPFVQGLINLRGAIVPVVDLRSRFGLVTQQPDAETIILIMSVHGEQGEKTMGIVVDRISEVVEVDEQHVVSAERFDLAIEDRFVQGITDVDGAMSILIDIDMVLKTEDFYQGAIAGE